MQLVLIFVVFVLEKGCGYTTVHVNTHIPTFRLSVKSDPLLTTVTMAILDDAES